MGIRNIPGGTVRMRVTTASPEDMLSCLNREGITVYDFTEEKPLVVAMTVSRKQYRQAAAVLTRRGDRVRLLGIRGAKTAALLRRPVLVLGILLCTAFFFWLPSRIFFVRIQGNVRIPTEYLLAQCEDCGLRFGAAAGDIRSESVKNRLLARIPQLQWAGVNLHGCVAEVTVREKLPPVQPEPERTVSHICAVRDAVILSATVQQGNTLCHPGQAVKKGQLLVSGYTDCGLLIRAGRSRGQIMGQTCHNTETAALSRGVGRGEVVGSRTEYTWIIGKRRFALPSLGSVPTGPESTKTSDTWVLTLPGNFRLPVLLQRETTTWYETRPVQTDCESLLKAYTLQYLTAQMCGGTVQRVQQQLVPGDPCWHLSGTYWCVESIGREIPAEK